MRVRSGVGVLLLALAVLLTIPGIATATCPTTITQGISKNTAVYLNVVPDTTWRPRGGEVWFQLTSPTPFDQVQVCFSWPDGTGLRPSTIVRRVPPAEAPVADDHTVTYAALVPELPDVGKQWWERVWDTTNQTPATGLGTVPIALMAVQAGSGATPVILVQQVGITSVVAATVLVLLLLIAVYVLLWAIADRRAQGATRRWGGSLLWLVTGTDGFASLSQFQIVLWTITVAACAAYVMALSGTLIDLPAGVLVLLGIASGAALVARVPSKMDNRQVREDMVTAQWSDLIVVDKVPDVTRVQMLIFTLVSAAFVILKVIVGYKIPTIPDNFLVLMGISNGVYLTGRTLPDGGGRTPGSTQNSAPAVPPPLSSNVNRPPPKPPAPPPTPAPPATPAGTPAGRTS
jgi:hypothetical protein